MGYGRLETCPNCGRTYSKFVNERCPVCGEGKVPIGGEL